MGAIKDWPGAGSSGILWAPGQVVKRTTWSRNCVELSKELRAVERLD